MHHPSLSTSSSSDSDAARGGEDAVAGDGADAGVKLRIVGVPVEDAAGSAAQIAEKHGVALALPPCAEFFGVGGSKKSDCGRANGSSEMKRPAVGSEDDMGALVKGGERADSGVPRHDAGFCLHLRGDPADHDEFAL
jgi:hypothetical protein